MTNCIMQMHIMVSIILVVITCFAEESLDVLRKRARRDRSAVLQLRARLEPLADAGDTNAMIELAEWYHYTIPSGWVTESDKQKAFELYLQAAARGSAKGMYRVGYCYHYGKCVAKNRELGFKWYRKAADHGSFEAYKELAHEAGYQGRKRGSIKSGLIEEIRVWREAAGKGIPAACLALGDLYNKDILADYNQAEIWYRKCIELGGRAERSLALMYETKRKDGREAVKWFIQEYECEPDVWFKYTAALNIARIYEEGKIIARDYAEAYKWYNRVMDFVEKNKDKLSIVSESGALGSIKVKLAEFHFHGWHVPMDFAKGVKLLREGAEMSGDGEACHTLSAYYMMGLSGPINGDTSKIVQVVKSDWDEAMRWERKGAEDGYYDSIFGLCVDLLLREKHDEAYKWLEKGAEKEDGEHIGFFKYNLSLCYARGYGCLTDKEKARDLLRESARKGYDKAIDMCKKINLSY